MKKNRRRGGWGLLFERLEERTLFSTSYAVLTVQPPPALPQVRSALPGSVLLTSQNFAPSGTNVFWSSGTSGSSNVTGTIVSSGTLHLGGTNSSGGTIVVNNPLTYRAPMQVNSSGPATVIDPAVISVTLTSLSTLSGQLPTPTGMVSIYDDTTLLGTAALVDGQASFQPTLNARSHSLKVQYSGDSIYADESEWINQDVRRSNTLLALQSPVMELGAWSTTTVTAVATSEAGQVPDGQMAELYEHTAVGDVLLATTAVANGVASFNYTPATVGDHTLFASLLQNDTFAASQSAAVTLSAAKIDSSLDLHVTTLATGIQLAAAASSVDDIPSAPTGTIDFYDNGRLLATVTLGQGSLFKLPLSAGTHHFSAVYAGDELFLGSSVSVSTLLARPTNAPAAANAPLFATNRSGERVRPTRFLAVAPMVFQTAPAVSDSTISYATPASSTSAVTALPPSDGLSMFDDTWNHKRFATITFSVRAG